SSVSAQRHVSSDSHVEEGAAFNIRDNLAYAEACQARPVERRRVPRRTACAAEIQPAASLTRDSGVQYSQQLQRLLHSGRPSRANREDHMSMSRQQVVRARLLLVALALCVGFAATSSTAQGSSQAKTLDLKIADIVPLTGANASFGPSFHKAAELAVAQAQVAAKATGVSLQITLKEGDEG